VQEAEVDIRKTEREPLDDLANMAKFGRWTFEKFLACRSVIEEIGDLDGRPRRPRSVPLLLDRATLKAKFGAARSAHGRGHEPDARDGGDTRKGLASKSQGAKREQVGVGADFTCGVTQKCARGVGLRHPFSVIGDANMPAAGFGHIYGYPARAGVNGVLDQLFDGGRGPLHNFAGRDSVRDLERQHRDL
jgi:hypothetical protein